jgi:hypothetical protein
MGESYSPLSTGAIWHSAYVDQSNGPAQFSAFFFSVTESVDLFLFLYNAFLSFGLLAADSGQIFLGFYRFASRSFIFNLVSFPFFVNFL